MNLKKNGKVLTSKSVGTKFTTTYTYIYIYICVCVCVCV